ncbi:MAG TPA: hypothetical protein VGW76_05265 [Pyrinomonadaceae bacterium]|nr:hypothetical protein [Pyrinomonadaceae bacterium]
MTFITQLSSRRTFSARVLAIVSVGFVLVVLQSSIVQAQQWTTTGTNISNTNTGNVGIGAPTPSSKLEVVGDINAKLTLNAPATTDVRHIFNGAAAWLGQDATNGELNFGHNLYYNNGFKYRIAGTAANIRMYLGAFQFQTAAAGSSGGAITWADSMVISANGNVGIGTTSPQNPLTIARSGSAPWTGRPAYELLQLVDRTNNTPQILFGSAFNGMFLRYTGTDGTATNQRLGIFTGGLVEAFMVNNDGKVGIGTATPNFNLDVNRGSASADVVLGIDANGSNTFGPMLYFRNTGTAISKIMSSANLQFQNTNNTPLLYLQTNGNFGIGTTNPSKKLDVAGDINATGTITGGTIQAKYQDVAEWVESSQGLTAGTVVVLDHTKSNQVIASSQAYDTRVAGVISLQPGITLGESGTGKVLVATTGRVKVKVDATSGPIRVGDLLVTSEKEGVAKKSEPLSLGGVPIHRPGTLIGKALERLERGTGEILVLLSLQ